MGFHNPFPWNGPMPDDSLVGFVLSHPDLEPPPNPTNPMKLKVTRMVGEAGKIGKIALLWLIGIPLPIAVIAIYLGGCD